MKRKTSFDLDQDIIGRSFELENFEKDLFNVVNSIRFSNYTTDFQQKLDADIVESKQSKNVFVFPDKTSNIYKWTEQYKKLLGENVTKTYKKTLPKLQRPINLEAKNIATKIKSSGCIKELVETPAYVTLKDYKDNSRSKPSCRLINPSNGKIGTVSKVL